MRITRPLVQVARALMEEPTGRHWGYELFKRSGVRSGVLYPMLSRLLEEGLLADGWEDPAISRDGRPPRRYYTVTTKGQQELGAVIRKAGSEPRFAPLFNRASPAQNYGSISRSFASCLGRLVAFSPAGRWD